MANPTAPTPAQRRAARERPPGWPVMRQRWSHLLFVHWPVDPAPLAARLPAGLHVDLHDGRAWLGVVPFFMRRVRPSAAPPLPWISWFLELNVRTYVHADDGTPGVWFFSLDCNQPLAVTLARRLFHLPYEHATMRAEQRDGAIHYRSRRRGGASEASFEYRPPVDPRPAAAGSLEEFLVERYVLFSAKPDGTLYSGRVHHAPYRIATADRPRWSAVPLSDDGFPEPVGDPLSMLVAEPVDVEVFPLRRHPAGPR